MKKTPLYEEHLKLGAKVIDFGGWLMPVQYTNVIDEHITTRTKAGLFDICHMGKFLITGNGAFRLIQKLITNDLDKLSENKALYTAMCYENGTTVDDLFVYCFNHTKYMLVVNAANIEKDLEWIKKHSSDLDVEIQDKTDETAKIDVQGPKSEEILQKLTNFNLSTIKRFHFIETEINNVKTTISRTGYTAEHGFEIYLDSKKAAEIWNNLLTEGKSFGIKPVGLGARDTLRIEACYPLYGHEQNGNISPIEAGINFIVKTEKEEFIGKEILIKQKQEGTKRKIVAFEMIDKAVPRNDYKILKDGKEIGFVTSGTFSPTFKKGIGLAMVDTKEAKENNEILIRIREKDYKAKIVHKPFYKYNGR